jgi:hypothetical protein
MTHSSLFIHVGVQSKYSAELQVSISMELTNAERTPISAVDNVRLNGAGMGV